MPNSRHHRNHRHKDEDAHNNNDHEAAAAAAMPAAAAIAAPASARPREVAAAAAGGGGGGGGGGGHGGMGHHRRMADDNNNAPGARLQKCCSPGSCRCPDDTIDPHDPYDAVKVVCNNENCHHGVWMHKDCFDDFQDSVLAYLRSCGRARSWSEKQRLQNLWTKKGYDLAFKACDCKCGRGHLRKDLDYFPPAPVNDNARKQKKHKKKNDKPMPVVSTTHKSNSHSSHQALLHQSQHNGNNHLNANPPPASSGGHHTTSNNNNGNSTSSTTTTVPGTHVTTTPGSHHQHQHQHGSRTNPNPTTVKKSSTKKATLDNVHYQQRLLDNHSTTSTTTTTTADIMGSSPGLILTNNNNSNSHINVYGVMLPPGNNNHNSQLRLRTNSVSSVGSVGSHASSISSSAGSVSPISSSPVSGDMFFKTPRKSSSDASCSGDNPLLPAPITHSGFRQRLDMSAFASLPRFRQNPYHIRMEDSSSSSGSGSLASVFSSSCSVAAAAKVKATHWEVSGGGGEDGGCDAETRNFVLSNLLSKRMCSTRCVLCKGHLPVFDRFPLVDGTFFLSPQPYDEAAIQVIWDGRLQFLNAACLGCLEGRSAVKCVACKRAWDGRSLVMGSMYTYDIFAAAPCCQKRLTCKCCRRAVVDIATGLDFFSQYSHMIICPYCKANDYHFIRSLPETFVVSESEAGLPAPICL